jgi:hypothetical protein
MTAGQWREQLGLIDFETLSPAQRLAKKLVFNPLGNYLPSSLLRAALRFGKSEMAASNWADPGGWRSMVISYDGKPRQIADKILVGAGTMAKALRNRRKLGSRVLARLIEQANSNDVHVLCLGAGPGLIISDAMNESARECETTLVDISSDAFDYGRRVARDRGHQHRVRFIQCDVRDAGEFLDRPADVVKMLGICEYLADEQIVTIARALATVMPVDGAIVFNSLSRRHGTDRFFRRVLGLNMTHRTPQQLQALMVQGGFGRFVALPEPLGVYHVIIGRRLAEADPAAGADSQKKEAKNA